MFKIFLIILNSYRYVAFDYWYIQGEQEALSEFVNQGDHPNCSKSSIRKESKKKNRNFKIYLLAIQYAYMSYQNNF